MGRSPAEESSLTDDMPGVHLVSTEDGTELRVDLEARTVRTFPAPVFGLSPHRDSESASLILLATCRVGEPMVLLVDFDVPGVWFTRRATSPVTRIVREDAGRGRLQ